MMYILTEQEYQALKDARTARETKATKATQRLMTKIADELPVKWGWGGPDPKPWGCIITAEARGEEWYCDTCPVESICEYDYKEFSK